jgi:two-component system, cell cycle sensor histidine kinase and response regulator CckA
MEKSIKTILVVDDDAQVLNFVSKLLIHGSCYKILTATCAKEAIQLSQAYEGDIDLLLSDFQMPEKSGVVLATEMILERPNLKVLLMSGFTDGMLVLNEGWHFLAKPFVASQLTALVLGLIAPNLAKHPESVPDGHLRSQ